MTIMNMEHEVRKIRCHLLYQLHRYYFECSVAYNICFII